MVEQYLFTFKVPSVHRDTWGLTLLLVHVETSPPQVQRSAKCSERYGLDLFLKTKLNGNELTVTPGNSSVRGPFECSKGDFLYLIIDHRAQGKPPFLNLLILLKSDMIMFW